MGRMSFQGWRSLSGKSLEVVNKFKHAVIEHSIVYFPCAFLYLVPDINLLTDIKLLRAIKLLPAI